VAVGAEPLAWRHPVFIDDQQRPEAGVLRIAIVAKRERVLRLQPAVVGVAAVMAFRTSNMMDSVSLW
jgi:hypothetical protein